MSTRPTPELLGHITKLFEETFGPIGDRPVLYAHAPGRSEVAGNHTDHEGGHVIAASLDVSADGLAVANGTNVLRLYSEGRPQVEVDLTSLEPVKEEEGKTAAILRGMAHEVAARGGKPAGFDIAMTCNVPLGGGLSSSAACEGIWGRVMEAMWGAEAADPVTLAQMSQRAENIYYGKPCGLMDQAAVCLGGLAFMNFENLEKPETEKLELSFEDHGYALVLVKVGADHAASTDDYASVPAEMQAVAAKLGHTRLCEVDKAEFDAKLPELTAEFGDRAIMRCVHYWYENDLVDKRWEALKAGDVDTFVALHRASSASSAMYLQNVVAELGREQPAMYALALAEHILNGRGGARIHGGGFGGTIQVFVPLDIVDEFMEKMDAWLGEGSSRRHQVTDEGAYAEWL